MNDIFKSSEFGEIRTRMNENEQPMFCLKDVAKALSITNHKNITGRLNPKGVHSMDTLTNGGVQSMIFIDEPNLYKCIFMSRKEKAQRFTDWVTSDVLPSIRKNGIYVLEQTNKSLQTQNSFLLNTITNNAHKVQIAESMMSNNLYYVRDVANYINQAGYKCGQNILFIWLRNNGWCYMNGYNTNVATGYAIKNSWLVNSYDDGNVCVKVTKKGFDKLSYLYTHNQSDDVYQTYIDKLSEPELPLVFE